MAFDAGVVSFGLSQVFLTLFKLPLLVAYGFWAVILAIDVLLLYRYLRDRRAISEPLKVPVPSSDSAKSPSSGG